MDDLISEYLEEIMLAVINSDMTDWEKRMYFFRDQKDYLGNTHRLSLVHIHDSEYCNENMCGIAFVWTVDMTSYKTIYNN